MQISLIAGNLKPQAMAISSEASTEERSTTITQVSRHKCVETGDTSSR